MTDEAKALVERMGKTLGEWLVDEAPSDWWEYQRDHMKARDLIETQAREIERLREALKDALSHCYNCSGDPHYIEEDEATGDHLWTDCPVCRSARAALGESND